MKLKITQPIPPVDVMSLDKVHISQLPPREVYINDERCPPELEQIILDSIDYQTGIYVAELYREYKESKK